jgi:hypothetical protein
MRRIIPPWSERDYYVCFGCGRMFRYRDDFFNHVCRPANKGSQK